MCRVAAQQCSSRHIASCEAFSSRTGASNTRAFALSSGSYCPKTRVKRRLPSSATPSCRRVWPRTSVYSCSTRLWSAHAGFCFSQAVNAASCGRAASPTHRQPWRPALSPNSSAVYAAVSSPRAASSSAAARRQPFSRRAGMRGRPSAVSTMSISTALPRLSPFPAHRSERSVIRITSIGHFPLSAIQRS